MMKSLQPITAQVTKLKTIMTNYGESIDKLSRPKFLNIIKDLIPQEAKNLVTRKVQASSNITGKLIRTAKYTMNLKIHLTDLLKDMRSSYLCTLFSYNPDPNVLEPHPIIEHYFLSMFAVDQSTSEPADNAQAMHSRTRHISHKPPNVLELIKYVKIPGWCRCVSWTKDGNILSSSEYSKITVLSVEDLARIKQIDLDGMITSAYAVKEVLISKSRYKDFQMHSYMGTQSNPTQTLLSQYKNRNLSHLAVSKDRIADFDADLGKLTVYSITGDHQFNVYIKDIEHHWGIHILPDGCLLMSDHAYKKGKVKKYKLQTGTQQPIWSVNVDRPFGITTDQSGLIYVVPDSDADRKICQITPQGEMCWSTLPKLSAFLCLNKSKPMISYFLW